MRSLRWSELLLLVGLMCTRLVDSSLLRSNQSPPKLDFEAALVGFLPNFVGCGASPAAAFEKMEVGAFESFELSVSHPRVSFESHVELNTRFDSRV